MLFKIHSLAALVHLTRFSSEPKQGGRRLLSS